MSKSTLKAVAIKIVLFFFAMDFYELVKSFTSGVIASLNKNTVTDKDCDKTKRKIVTFQSIDSLSYPLFFWEGPQGQKP